LIFFIWWMIWVKVNGMSGALLQRTMFWHVEKQRTSHHSCHPHRHFSLLFFHIYIYFLSLLVRSFELEERKRGKKEEAKKKEEQEVGRKKKRNVCYSFFSDFRWSTYRESTMTSDNNIDNTIDVFFLFLNGITPYLYTYYFI